MSSARKSLWWLTVPFAIVLVITYALMAPNGLSLHVFTLTRALPLLGYRLIFVAVLSSAFLRQLVRASGRPFVSLHHVMALAGLALIALHPIMAGIAWGDPSLFSPRFTSLDEFLQYGGAPAFDLLLIASLAAVYRKRIRGWWQFVHGLTYLAFLMGTIHATTAVFVTDLRLPWLRWAAWLLALATWVAFALRRLVWGSQRRTKRS